MQHQTVTWGEEDHRRYCTFNYVVAFLSVVGLFAWFFLADETLRDAVLLFAPTAPFIAGRIQMGRRHQSVSGTRKELRETAESALDNVLSNPTCQPSIELPRAIQDRLFQERLQEGRIPQWLYRLGSSKHRRTIDTACSERVNRLRAATSTRVELG